MVKRQASHLWKMGNADLEAGNSSGFTGAALKTGARCIVALEAMSADGIDVKKYLDEADKALGREVQ